MSVFKIMKAESQSGFTLVEVVATVALMSIMLAMATGGLTTYFSTKALETSAAEVENEISRAQALALATGNTHRLDFSVTSSYTLQRRVGETWEVVRGPISFASDTAVASAVFGDEPVALEFYARGTSEGGQMVLQNGDGKTKVVTVTGETVNVEITNSVEP